MEKQTIRSVEQVIEVNTDWRFDSLDNLYKVFLDIRGKYPIQEPGRDKVVFCSTTVEVDGNMYRLRYDVPTKHLDISVSPERMFMISENRIGRNTLTAGRYLQKDWELYDGVGSSWEVVYNEHPRSPRHLFNQKIPRRWEMLCAELFTALEALQRSFPNDPAITAARATVERIKLVTEGEISQPARFVLLARVVFLAHSFKERIAGERLKYLRESFALLWEAAQVDRQAKGLQPIGYTAFPTVFDNVLQAAFNIVIDSQQHSFGTKGVMLE